MQRRGILVEGRVQGVGFRPFVYRTAKRLGLTGRVGNTSEGVRIEVQGTAEAVAGMVRALREELPPLARITSLREEALDVLPDEAAFAIAVSSGRHGHGVLISPDIATCDACLAELFDPDDRRFLYPFINCTDCGPRFTITRSIPYDRAVTSMACFPFCPACADEYGDPEQRRFHAQPNACPVCGPRVWVARPGGPSEPPAENRDALPALQETAAALRDGAVAAIKGLGGFHLVCDARNRDAIRRLRERKNRPHKALAVMVADLNTARRVARLSPAEEAVLQSRERPIVIVPRLPGVLPDELSPDTGDVGLMLPYTPLHHVLLHLYAGAAAGPAALVATSGNAGGEPISLGNREALHRLRGIADLFLLHDRDILIRADDSVLRVPEAGGDAVFFRRARGFVPSPVPLGSNGPCVLALGAELKNTICLTKGADAFVSQHIGDVQNMETERFFRQAQQHLIGLLEVRPEAAVCDLHPDYASTRCAEESGLPVLRLQHHFAHIHAVLAEHGRTGPALGLALDGTGRGEDGTVWGGELLFVHPEAARALPGPFGPATPDPAQHRLGRLSPFPLPGGEAAIREPWRIACGLAALVCPEPDPVPLPVSLYPNNPETAEHIRDAVRHLARHGGLRTSSCGRLFDAVSALLGLCAAISYEGQAAIRLEQAQDFTDQGTLTPLLQERNELIELNTEDLFLRIAELRAAGLPAGAAARRFHRGLIEGLADLAAAGAERTGVPYVALSGGVLQNMTVARELPEALRRRGLTPLTHRIVPPGDGGLSLGQAAWARFCLRNR